jgi:hypothetical protein
MPSQKLDLIDAVEERAAIMEYDGRLSRQQAQDKAAQANGFDNYNHYLQWRAK